MEQQWALVTGASRGLGYAMADCLASKSYNIAMIARGEEELTLQDGTYYTTAYVNLVKEIYTENFLSAKVKP